MKANLLALKKRIFGGGGTVSGVFGAIGSVHNVCHSLCVTVVSILAIFGITTQILPLMFLQTYQRYFWGVALIFTGVSLYLYRQQEQKVSRDRNLLLINTGLLIFGLPFSSLSEYSNFFRFIGGGLALASLTLLIFGKRLKQAYFPAAPSTESPAGISETMPQPVRTTSSIQLPKLTMRSALFAVVIGGFLINQYWMYQMKIFSALGSQPGTNVTSAITAHTQMKFSPFDAALAKERMDKNNDGVCDTCGMPIQQCIDSGQMDCNMGNNPQAIGILGSQHSHADFKVYVNGQAVDFSDKDHMGRMTKNLPVSSLIHVDSGAPAPEKAGDLLHMHAANVPLGLFFKSIGMNFIKNSLTLDDGRVMKNENGNTLKFYINGKKVDSLDNYVFQDLDKILISYGPAKDAEISQQMNSITDFAKNH